MPSYFGFLTTLNTLSRNTLFLAVPPGKSLKFPYKPYHVEDIIYTALDKSF